MLHCSDKKALPGNLTASAGAVESNYSKIIREFHNHLPAICPIPARSLARFTGKLLYCQQPNNIFASFIGPNTVTRPVTSLLSTRACAPLRPSSSPFPDPTRSGSNWRAAVRNAVGIGLLLSDEDGSLALSERSSSADRLLLTDENETLDPAVFVSGASRFSSPTTDRPTLTTLRRRCHSTMMGETLFQRRRWSRKGRQGTI